MPLLILRTLYVGVILCAADRGYLDEFPKNPVLGNSESLEDIEEGRSCNTPALFASNLQYSWYSKLYLELSRRALVCVARPVAAAGKGLFLRIVETALLSLCLRELGVPTFLLTLLEAASDVISLIPIRALCRKRRTR